jgi:hypothetical protein
VSSGNDESGELAASDGDMVSVMGTDDVSVMGSAEGVRARRDAGGRRSWRVRPLAVTVCWVAGWDVSCASGDMSKEDKCDCS